MWMTSVLLVTIRELGRMSKPGTARQTNRLLSLFRCFQRAQKGICHTSIRNELVCLLHGVYEDIHLIEDAQATIEYFILKKLLLDFILLCIQPQLTVCMQKS